MPLIYPFKHLPHVCIGEVIFLVPIALIIYQAYNTTFTENKDIISSGANAEIALLGSVLLANKSNSLITFALGVPFERLIIWHQLWSYLAVAASAMHLWCAYTLGELLDSERRLAIIEEMQDERQLSGDGPHVWVETMHSREGLEPDFIKYTYENDVNLTGTLALLCMAALIIPASVSIMRRLFFEFWYVPHVIFAMGALVLALIHGSTAVIFAIAWWVIDLGTRYILMTGYIYPKKASIRNLSGDIVELSFAKPEKFNYSPGQFVMIALPKIGFAAFHPFTVSSSPHQDIVTIHAKVLGKWTRKLQALAEKETEVSFMMEGAYGSLNIDLNDCDRYKMVLLLSGGIGVTPMYSIGNDLLHQMMNEERDMKSLRFVWSIKSLDMLNAMKDYGTRNPGPTVLDTEKIDALKLDIYLTQKDTDVEAHSRTITQGRPDLNKIFGEMKDAAIQQGETSVAVLVCGPISFIDHAREASRQWSDACGGVKFDFHEETFEL
jgi:NADPH oxidase